MSKKNRKAKKNWDNTYNINNNKIVDLTFKKLPEDTGIPENRLFEAICRMSQKTLKIYLEAQLKRLDYSPIVEDGYIYAKGEVPILLTAHMDTVHKQLPTIIVTEKTEDGKTKVSSPYGIGGDDRCGIYMILKLLEKHKCYVLFCEDEEIGGVGSDKFCMTEHIKDLTEMIYMVELDRANEKDAVFYNCDNEDFTNFITDNTEYKESWGSFSDISNLSPETGIASVNLSCGYYNAHKTDEFVILEEMENTISVVDNLISTTKSDIPEPFVYIENNYTNYCGYGYSGYYGGYEYNNYSQYYGHDISVNSDVVYLEVIYLNKDRKEITTYVEGVTEENAWYSFFMENDETCFKDVLDFYVC